MPAGTIYTASQAKKELLESNRNYNNRLTWQNAITGVNAQAMEAQSKLNQQYINASTDAYVQYLQNKNALEGSNVVGVGREQLLQQTELALQDAYNSYAQSLQSGHADISAGQQEQLTNIEDALKQQAQYTADYTNAHIAYLKELWRRYENGENTLFDDPNWAKYKRYIVPMTDENGNPLTDENGNVIYDETQPSLLTDDELAAILYDEQGLTFSGVDFFDQLENEIANYDTGYSWSDYLQETNPELYDWANSYNPYNYTSEGSNAGTMRTMYGMLSDDYTYQYAERFGGITESQLKSTWNELRNAIDIDNLNIDTNFDDVNKAISDLIKDFGLTSELEAAGLTTESIKQISDAILKEYDDDKYKEIATGTALGITGGAAAAGALAGSMIVPGIGSLVGFLIGSVAGIGVSVSIAADANEHEEEIRNKANKELQQAYNKFVTELTNYTASKRRQSEIDFNRRTGRI